MDTKTKKFVASIVLGSFVVTTATPAFASDEMVETFPVQPVVVEQSLEDNITSDVETYSIPSKIAKELAEKLVKNWDSVIGILDKAGMDKALLDSLDFLRDQIVKALIDYDGAVATGKEIFADALESVGFEEETARIISEIVITILL